MIIAYCLLFTFLAWRNFNFALAFLFFCLPTYLIRFNLGPLPTTLLEVMIWIITIVWLIKYHKNIQYLISNIKNNKSLFISLSLFILAATISIFTSINTRAALGEWKAFYIEPIIVFLILITTLGPGYRLQDTGYRQQNDHNPINNILIALTFCGLLTSLLAIYQHFTGWLVPDAFWANRNTFRVTAWYGFPNAVGLFLAPIMPLTLYLISKRQSLIFNLHSFTITTLSIITTTTSLFAIYFAKSTGALVALAAGLIFFLFFYNKKARIFAIIFSCVALITLIFGIPQGNRIKDEFFLQDRSGQLRVDMWAETTEFLKTHPIAGAGLASYSKLIYPYRIDKWIEVFHHPHNLFLTMWVNLGLLGLLAFVWIIVAIFNFSRQSTGSRLYVGTIFNLCVLTSLVIILVMGLVDSPYIKNDLAILFWLLPALLITPRHCEERGTSDAAI